MAPINFENQIKDKLEGRHIVPKASSWETLADRLDEEQPKRKGYWWLGIAASFIGILIITTVMFNNNDAETVSPSIVDTKDKTDDRKQGVTTLEEQIQNKKEDVLAVSETENLKLDETNKKEDVKELKKLVKAQNQKELQLKEKAVIKEQIRENKTLVQTEIKEVQSKSESKVLSLEDQKLNAVVAELRKLDKANPYNVDDEVDSLLRAAQQEIRFQKLYDQAIQTVNADELLNEVEVDLDNSFRDRVFKALVSGYNGVKTAVTNRNN